MSRAARPIARSSVLPRRSPWHSGRRAIRRRMTLRRLSTQRCRQPVGLSSKRERSSASAYARVRNNLVPSYRRGAGGTVCGNRIGKNGAMFFLSINKVAVHGVLYAHLCFLPTRRFFAFFRQHTVFSLAKKIDVRGLRSSKPKLRKIRC